MVHFLEAETSAPSPYLSCRVSPPAMIGPRGQYASGWYDSSPRHINLADSAASSSRVQSWFHLQFTDPAYFVVVNLAHLGRAGNRAILIVDRRTGTSKEASVTRLLVRNRVQTNDSYREFYDGESGSFIRQDSSDRTIEFAVHAEDLHVSGRAQLQFEPAVQITGYPRGFGSLQWWGNLRLDEGTLQIGNSVVRLTPGSFGAYDRTVGHRHPVQNWNWLCVSGSCRRADAAGTSSFAIHAARDRSGGRPEVAAEKSFVWIDGQLSKARDVRFDYAPERAADSSWRIFSSARNEPRIELVFEPRFHRHESLRLPGLCRANFHQYYGELGGEIETAGSRYLITNTFAVTEDSFLRL